MKKKRLTFVLLFLGIILSILSCYYTMIVKSNYEIFINEDGIPKIDDYTDYTT